MDIAVGFVGILFMLLLLALSVPVSFAMGFAGLGGFAYLWSLDHAISLSVITAYTKSNSFMLACIPLFILMGQIVFRSGLAKNLFSSMSKWLAGLPGGLAMAVTAASACFASVCGSSPATAATMGAMALPEMKKFGYSSILATGCVAAAGTLGILIPPSIPMVIYGIMTEQSIGRLFIAGIVPGIISAILYMLMIYFRAKHNPRIAPPGPSSTLFEKVKSLSKIWTVMLLFIMVIGGIYFGIFTPTEASAVGAFVALIIGFAKKSLSRHNFLSALEETTRVTAMILAIIVGAVIFSTFMVTTGLPEAVAGFVANMSMNRYFILIGMLFVYLVLGCVMDVIGIIVLTVPLFFPIIMELGFNPIWFGIILTKMIEVSLITPPVGINCLIIKSVAGADVTVGQIFRGVGWFFVTDIIAIVILLIFPQISLFLPDLMYR